jgi:hypothetical protein
MVKQNRNNITNSINHLVDDENEIKKVKTQIKTQIK